MRQRKFVEFTVVTKEGDGEFAEEGSARAYVDINTIESFYETQDGCVVLEMDSCNGYKVRESIDTIRDILNDV